MFNLLIIKNWLNEAEQRWEQGQMSYSYWSKDLRVDINYPEVTFIPRKGKTLTVRYGVGLTYTWGK